MTNREKAKLSIDRVTKRYSAAQAAEVVSFWREHSSDDEVVRHREWLQVDQNPNPEEVLIKKDLAPAPGRRGRGRGIRVFRRAS